MYQILTFILSICASIIAAFLINRFCAPQIAISKNIICKSSGTSIIKIQNTSFLREIYDISIHLRYCSDKKDYYPTSLTPVALLKTKPTRRCKNTDDNEPYEIKLKLKYPRDNKEKEILLLDFFRNDTRNKPYLDVIIICSSKINGFTKHAIQQRYYNRDVLSGDYFFPEGSLEPMLKDDEGGIQNDHYN